MLTVEQIVILLILFLIGAAVAFFCFLIFGAFIIAFRALFDKDSR